MTHLPLLVWLSPAFPVGAFAYSHGLEWAHEAGDVTDAASLQEWLADLLAFGSARNDCVLFAEAFNAAAENDGISLAGRHHPPPCTPLVNPGGLLTNWPAR